LAPRSSLKLVDVDNITLVPSAYETVNNADAMILATEWNEYRQVDFDVIRKLMKGDLIVDTRNIYDPAKLMDLGLRYVGIGRKTHVESSEREPAIARG